MNFEIWKQNGGKGECFYFNKGCTGKFRIGTTWNCLFNRAVNAPVKWFYGKGGERQLWVVTQRSSNEFHFDATCTGTTG